MSLCHNYNGTQRFGKKRHAPREQRQKRDSVEAWEIGSLNFIGISELTDIPRLYVWTEKTTCGTESRKEYDSENVFSAKVASYLIAKQNELQNFGIWTEVDALVETASTITCCRQSKPFMESITRKDGTNSESIIGSRLRRLKSKFVHVHENSVLQAERTTRDRFANYLSKVLWKLSFSWEN